MSGAKQWNQRSYHGTSYEYCYYYSYYFCIQYYEQYRYYYSLAGDRVYAGHNVCLGSMFEIGAG